MVAALLWAAVGHADPFDSLVESAFRCVPLGGAAEIPTQAHQVPAIGVSIDLPLSWTDPIRTSRFDATVRSPDGRTRVRLTRQALEGEKASAVIEQTERRHLGPERQSAACAEIAAREYAVEGASQLVVRLHASGMLRSAHRATHALHLVADGVLISVMVEQRWKRRTGPRAPEADAILGSIRLLKPPSAPVSPSS